MKINLNIAKRDILFAFGMMVVGSAQMMAADTPQPNAMYLLSVIISFATIKAFGEMSGEILKPINIKFDWLKNKYTAVQKTVCIITNNVCVNLLRVGTNSGRLTEHLDTEFYRNRIRRVH